MGSLLFPNELFAFNDIENFPYDSDVRSLKFFNVNSLEHLNITYYENGDYISEAHTKINDFMADKRSGQTTIMDLALIDTLHKIHALSDSKQSLEIICGYRSPNTNETLRHTKRGIAQHSYHTLGQAADISIKDFPLHKLRDIAISLNVGGVGFYPNSGFVHVDVGPVRRWIG